PGALPTDPDVKVSLLRCLGSPQACAHGSPNRRHPVWRITLLSQPLLDVVQDPGCRKRQWAMDGIDTLLPVDVALVAAPAEPGWPSTLGILAGTFAPLAIATDTIGVVRAAQLHT